MRLSGIFWNNASGVATILPTIMVSAYTALSYGPSGIILPVVVGGIIYSVRNHISNSGFSRNSLTRLDPTEDHQQISTDIGLSSTPPMFSLERGRHSNAFASFNNAVMSEDFFDKLTPKEQNFVWAHEFAHIRRNDSIAPKAAQYGLITSAFGFLSMMGLGVLDNIINNGDMVPEMTGSMPFIGAFALSAMATFIRQTKHMNHVMEFDCDKRAALATGNIDAAISCLQKLSVGRRDPSVSSHSHPAIQDRIKALHALKVSEEAHYKVVKTSLERLKTDKQQPSLQAKFA